MTEVALIRKVVRRTGLRPQDVEKSVMATIGIIMEDPNFPLNMIGNIYDTTGSQVFNSYSDFKSWLNHSQPLLDNKKPIEVLKQKNGKEKVENVLLRLIHGVLA